MLIVSVLPVTGNLQGLAAGRAVTDSVRGTRISSRIGDRSEKSSLARHRRFRRGNKCSLLGAHEAYPLVFAAGSNEAINVFVASVLKRSPPSQRMQMYTRLWWYADQVSYDEVNIFRDMGASWSRMKEGFDSLRRAIRKASGFRVTMPLSLAAQAT